ncbi:MAG: betaine--homocysteine S-methyltransferase [Anaerolineales bacterium]|nr:betaine--homocysteine S-methyltransferase [Anaerolineales bacterium]MDW8447629.1 betaine--homocysteine S-methyltransferase [Anaerolineales bacterium]
MNRFEQLLSQSKTILLDGAMGTMLMSKGLEAGQAPERMNLERPEIVKEIHKAYIEAGSMLILTNSFGANRYRLQRHGLEDRVRDVNQAAARLAREVADEYPEVVVAGSIGPTGELMVPFGKLMFEDAVRAFAEQAAGLASGGVDVIWIETMADLQEVRAAVEGARLVTRLPVVVTMTFESRGRTMMGVTPEQLVQLAHELELSAVGANCGKGPQELERVIERISQAGCRVPIIAKANAGIPKLVEGKVIYDGSPQIMAEHAQAVRRSGAKLIGACCGSSPEHIREMRQALFFDLDLLQ